MHYNICFMMKHSRLYLFLIDRDNKDRCTFSVCDLQQLDLFSASNQ